MSKRLKWRGMFFYADTEGIPLEMIATRVAGAGLNLEWELLAYAADALKAGWKPEKIASELREATAFGLNVPKVLFNALNSRAKTAHAIRVEEAHGVAPEEVGKTATAADKTEEVPEEIV